MTTLIQAIQVHHFGSSDQLTFEQIPQPEPKEGEVLVRVYAAGVNPMDWKIRVGVSQTLRPQSFPYVPGVDFAGVIESVGAGVTAFHVGQEVFGCAWGTYTQYALAPVHCCLDTYPPRKPNGGNSESKTYRGRSQPESFPPAVS